MSVLRRLPIAVVAAVALFLAAPTWAIEPDPLLPDDTEIAVGINVRVLLESPLIKKDDLEKLRELLKEQDEVQKHLTDLGFDPLKDLDRIVVGGGAGNDDERGLIIIRGSFNVTRFKAKAEEVAKEHGNVFKILSVKDGAGKEHPVYQVDVPNADSMLVALIDDKTMVAGPKMELLVDAIDKAAGRKKGALKSKALLGLLGKLSGKEASWMAIPGSALAQSPLAANPDAKEILDKVESVVGGVTVEKGLKIEVTIATKDADAAKDIASKINDGLGQAKGLIALVAAQQKELAGVIDLVNALKTTTDGKSVVIKAEVSGDKLQKRDQ